MSMNQPITFPTSKLGGTTYVQSIGGASPTSYLFYDQVPVYNIPGIPASGPDSVGHLTTVQIGGVTYPVSAAVEVQSTQGGSLLPRMTTAQRTATSGGSTGLGFIPFNGMQVYDTDLQAQMSYINSAWANMNPVTIRQTVSISAAQFGALFTTPIQLIPAVAGKLIVVENITWLVDYVAGITGGGVFVAQYGNTAAGAGTAAVATLTAVTLTGITADQVILVDGGASFSFTQAASVGLGLFVSNQTANFVPNGSSLRADITYKLVDVS